MKTDRLAEMRRVMDWVWCENHSDKYRLMGVGDGN